MLQDIIRALNNSYKAAMDRKFPSRDYMAGYLAGVADSRNIVRDHVPSTQAKT